MDFIRILEHIGKNGAVLAPLLIISLGAAVAFDELFPRDRLSKVFMTGGLPGSLIASITSAVLPQSAGGKIPLAARFRGMGGRLLPTLSFAIAGSALSLPAIVLTLSLGWRFALLRLGSVIIFGVVAGTLAHTRLQEGLKLSPPVDWLSICEPDYCDIRPNPEEWEKTYPWRSYLRLLGLSIRILFPWLILSLILAAMLEVVIPPKTLTAFLGQWWSPALAAVSGFPLFLAVGTDVPLVQTMLSKGVPLASAVSFMLGAPVVNFPVYAMLKRWLGRSAALGIIIACWLIATGLGWFLMFVGWAGRIIF